MTPSSAAPERPKRFWAQASAVEAEGGFAVALDSRRVRTPAGRPLVLPTRALAELVAGEWAAQGEHVEMAAMHATRLAFTAADHAARARVELVAEVARFAASDLVCYFAEAPSALVALQTRRWGALLHWAEQDLGLVFVRVQGIVHAPQPPQTLARVEALAGALDDMALAGLAFGAALFGSAVIALALQRDQLDGEAAFDLARLDEAFQESQWGVDEEAAARAAKLKAEALMLERWFSALR
jgi:chaperone required for assembly of F1-ATPase